MADLGLKQWLLNIGPALDREIQKRQLLKSQTQDTLRLNKYISHYPDIKQQEQFLRLTCKEALYGGAAGGGKSDALLMAALQYVDVPGYAAILFRKTYQDLSLAGGLIPRSHEWLATTDAKWDAQTKTWHFPAGSSLSFGYMDSQLDHFRYQGSEYQFIGWDELTQFTEAKYKYMYSRLRGLKDNPVPLRVRAASNPGGVGHLWVKKRFIDKETRDPQAVFIPARVYDNKHIKVEEYVDSLSFLDPVTRARYLDGDWTVTEGGTMFKRQWFTIVDAVPQKLAMTCAWDLAATEVAEGKDPDWTAGVVMGRDEDGFYWILNVIRARETPAEVEKLVKQTAQMYGADACDYWMEQEPGSSGVNTIDYYRRKVLAGFYFREEKTTGKKSDRARPFSSMAQAGNIRLLKGRWNGDFLDELEIFPTEGAHDDQVDAASLAFSKCAGKIFGSIYDGAILEQHKPQPKTPETGEEDAQVTNRFGMNVGRHNLSGTLLPPP